MSSTRIGNTYMAYTRYNWYLFVILFVTIAYGLGADVCAPCIPMKQNSYSENEKYV